MVSFSLSRSPLSRSSFKSVSRHTASPPYRLDLLFSEAVVHFNCRIIYLSESFDTIAKIQQIGTKYIHVLAGKNCLLVSIFHNRHFKKFKTISLSSWNQLNKLKLLPTSIAWHVKAWKMPFSFHQGVFQFASYIENKIIQFQTENLYELKKKNSRYSQASEW